MSTVDIVRTTAWILLATIAFVRIAPTHWRAPTIVSAHLDHALAFVLMAMLFALSYPSERRAVAIFCILIAVASELLKLLSPQRNARVGEALSKAFGALTGVVIGAVVLQLMSLYH